MCSSSGRRAAAAACPILRRPAPQRRLTLRLPSTLPSAVFVVGILLAILVGYGLGANVSGLQPYNG